jgi:hypothetical protein
LASPQIEDKAANGEIRAKARNREIEDKSENGESKAKARIGEIEDKAANGENKAKLESKAKAANVENKAKLGNVAKHKGRGGEGTMSAEEAAIAQLVRDWSIGVVAGHLKL